MYGIKGLGWGVERVLTLKPKEQPDEVGRWYPQAEFWEELPGRAVEQTIRSEENIGVEESTKPLPET